MKIGVIGLGKMGGPIAKKLQSSGCDLYVYDTNPAVQQEFKNLNINVTESINQISKLCDVLWLMVGQQFVDDVLNHLCSCIKPNSIIIDGGNSYYVDSIRRAQEMKNKNIEYLDCGTSGGLYGAEHGFSLTIGGDSETFKKVESIFKDLAASAQSYAHVGPSGAGHYVKMVHNGIEYALMQSYAEGFHLLHSGYYKNLDMAKISNAWQHGSIIRSWLLTMAHETFLVDQNFDSIAGAIDQTGMGRWTVDTAHKYAVPVTLIEDAVKIRENSRKTAGNYATKLVALLRHKMGGHPVELNQCTYCNTNFK